MLGSSNSISCANIMINSAVAESLKVFADKLENAADFNAALTDLIKETVGRHKRILFNGNGYEAGWIAEAEKRGLMNMRTTPDCIPHLLDEKNVKMLTSHGVFTEKELASRCEILLENYCKTVVIEANTMVGMAKKQIVPAVVTYMKEIAETASAKKAVMPDVPCDFEKTALTKLSNLSAQIAEKADELEKRLIEIKFIDDVEKEGYAIRDTILPKMAELRAVADEAETYTAEKYWPFPTYGELLFSVK